VASSAPQGHYCEKAAGCQQFSSSSGLLAVSSFGCCKQLASAVSRSSSSVVWKGHQHQLVLQANRRQQQPHKWS
jgi:hypothetical protein